MLIDKYIEHPHFRKRHRTEVRAAPQDIYSAIRSVDFCDSRVIKLLFTLRGVPRQMCSLQGFIDAGFALLEDKPDDEMVIGLLFHPVKFRPVSVSPDEFRTFDRKGYVKAIMNFHISEIDQARSLLTTESRVFCTSGKARLMFTPYWLLISRFSGLIRIMMLRLIREEAERARR
jgi:hypothetical protein